MTANKFSCLPSDFKVGDYPPVAFAFRELEANTLSVAQKRQKRLKRSNHSPSQKTNGRKLDFLELERDRSFGTDSSGMSSQYYSDRKQRVQMKR